MCLHLIFIEEELPQLVCLAKLLEAKKPWKCSFPTRDGPAGYILGFILALFHIKFFNPYQEEPSEHCGFFPNFCPWKSALGTTPRCQNQQGQRLSIQVSCRRGGLGEGSMDTCTGNDTPREPGIHPGSLDLGAHNTHIAQMPKIFHQKLLHRGAQLLRLNYFF